MISSYTTWVINCHGRKLGQELKAGTQRQEVKQRPWREAAYWFESRLTFNYLLIQLRTNYIPGGGATHSEINLPPWIATEKKNAHKHRHGPV